MSLENALVSVKVVVLGDIGRSPRMQYHALSLASSGIKVNIISYTETKPLHDVEQNANIKITKLHRLEIGGPKLIQYFAKALWQSISLLLTLFITGKCDFVMCQNPPAIPTLPICKFYCLITKTKFIIDWHNYAYSIMALSLKSDHPLLKLSSKIEKWFGQGADNNLCVTYALKEDLLEKWSIIATVLYDKPPRIFYPLSQEEKHNWFVKLGKQYEEFTDLKAVNPKMKTAFTEVVDGNVTMRSDRPGLLFSSTSWTPDEDFSILMDALQVYETTYNLSRKMPKLVCVITGQGPMKEYYRNQIALRNWKNVTVITPWLEAADYPKMVASAELGVCLHTSSSGLDLPMKIVDMFGAGLPVAAYQFKCLSELVQDGINGYTFQNSAELSKQIVGWFENFPNNKEQIKIADKMRRELIKFQESRWEDNWNLRAKKFFEL
ncbi:unnamed protein product [Pieris macdunnoughi]|uniref:Chitobiosyldiphosphodolichol beta-mannosyltransferase n=2 Tax=Pieris TaxID=7115 RepID=A0A821WMA4_9NEOP|nr:unnamed protein product [Pieris macdunnoughi]